MAGFNFLGLGYDKDGYNKKGYDRQGFNREGYNKDGFDRSGFDKDGYDKSGFDKDGYNRDGFNRIGYNRDGFDINGFDRHGRTQDGYDQDGFDKDGFSRDGYDRNGFNRDGYDRDGYNRDGFNNLGYDKDGFDRSGFDKDGFDRSGFNVEGYDRNGLDRNGFDKDGYDRDGYDKNGFDPYGYNRLGFDVEGYDRDGFNPAGYNRDGYNREGFDKLGFDRNGFDKEGYSRDGFNKKGYNRDGYDIDGYNEAGYDKSGFDRSGYDRQGYDRDGFDKDGFNRKGFNKSGFDRNGFDIEGYDQAGYNAQGYNRDGFNSDGVNIWKYNSQWIDENGFDAFGYDQDGYNRDGYDIDGFNRDGYDQYGAHRDEFDEDGFHKRTGFNRHGYNRRGEFIGGKKALPKDSQFDENGYDSNGVPRTQFNLARFLDEKNTEKVTPSHKKSFSELTEGDTLYHPDLGIATIKQFKGDYLTLFFSRTAETKEFTKESFGTYLFLEPTKENIQMEESFDAFEFDSERFHLQATLEYISSTIAPALRTQLSRKWSAKAALNTKKVIGKSGFIETVTPDYSESSATEYQSSVSRMRYQPYFARMCSMDGDFYISKSGAGGSDLISWQDPQCQTYYQYQLYIGNAAKQLSLIRDFSLFDSKLYGYVDKYNATSQSEYQKYADEHLRKIVQANRNNKGIHDIISSIQHNQYEIMVNPAQQDLLVLGCAGSGKTMILLHRLSYLLYNNPDIQPEDIYVISPTQYLNVECGLLSQTLSLENINQYVVKQLYREIVSHFYSSRSADLHIADKISSLYSLNWSAEKLASVYSQESMDAKAKLAERILEADTQERNTFIREYEIRIEAMCAKFPQQFEEEITIQTLCNYVAAFVEECNSKQYSLANLEEMAKIVSIKTAAAEELYSLRQLLVYFLENNCLHGTDTENTEKKERAWLRDVKSKKSTEPIISRCAAFSVLYKNIDALDLYYASNDNDPPRMAIVQLLQALAKQENITVSHNQAVAIYKTLQTMSIKQAETIIEAIDDKLEDAMQLPYYADILKALKAKKWFSHSGNKSPKSYDNFLKDLCTLYQLLEWDGEAIGDEYRATDDIVTPFDFIDAWNALQDRKRKLDMFTLEDSDALLYEVVTYAVDDRFLLHKNDGIENEFQLFAHAHIGTTLGGAVSYKRRYIFFDEFQDLALSEISLVNAAFPNAVFNFYGDLLQCISPKGIRDKKILLELLPDIKRYLIQENYRNASDITDFINSKLHTSMTSIGIHGTISALKRTDPSALKVSPDDRIVYIVKDKEHIDYNLMQELGILCGWMGPQAQTIPHGVPVALSVQDVKGLEFEVVIVDSTDMTSNEQYVAFTRALNKLYLLE